MSEGWIKLHRKLFEHWLWDNKPKSKFEAWLWIIQRANHMDNKFMLGNQLIDVKRGQIITSEKKMMELFKWSKTKLRNFLKTLENESMIEIKRDSKKTTLNVMNYDVYQDKETTKKPLEDRKKTGERPLKDTNKNDKNLKNEEKEKKKDLNNINFQKLFEEYPNSKGSKSQTLKNYETCKKMFSLTEDQIYLACMNSVEKQKEDGSGDYIYQLSNLLGLKYRADLSDLLNYQAAVKNETKFSQEVSDILG